jgi:hypothetical protein
MQSKGRDVISLRDYGAALNGVDDDVPAWAKLFADHPLGGITVTLDGYCRLNSTVAPPAGMSDVVVDCGGGGHFYNPSHGFDFIHMPATVAGWEFNLPRFFTDSGASGGTPVYFLRNDSDSLTTRGFWARNMWSGLLNTGPKTVFEGRTYLSALKPGAGVAMVVDMGANEVFSVNDIYGENAALSDCLAGVQIISGASIILGGTMAKCGTPLLVAPTNGKVVATLGLWPFFNGDTSSANGAQFTATGTGVIQRVEGVLRVSSNALAGLRADVSPRSADLQMRAVQNGGDGASLLSGGSQHNSRYRMMGFGNGGSAFNVANGCTDWSADIVGGSGDDFGGNARYTAEIGTGCDHFDLRAVGAGDTLGLLLNGSGTSATKVVTTRN